jgi:hypothetical protein
MINGRLIRSAKGKTLLQKGFPLSIPFPKTPISVRSGHGSATNSVTRTRGWEACFGVYGERVPQTRSGINPGPLSLRTKRMSLRAELSNLSA